MADYSKIKKMNHASAKLYDKEIKLNRFDKFLIKCNKNKSIRDNFISYFYNFIYSIISA